MPKVNTLTAKQQTALENYLNPQSQTFNNLLQSMVRAGYTQKYADHHGWELVGKDHIIAYMKQYKAELYGKQAITTEYIQAEHQRLAEKAEEAGDLAVATRNKELLGKTIAAYADKSIVEQHLKLDEIDQAQQSQAKQIESIILDNHLSGLLPKPVSSDDTKT